MTDTVGEMTERLLIDAGIGLGMGVIDVGCGRGDVSCLVARLVGEQGQVLGVDRDAGPLAAARERARELNLSGVTFAQGDFCALSPEHGQFDGAVGRGAHVSAESPSRPSVGSPTPCGPVGWSSFKSTIHRWCRRD